MERYAMFMIRKTQHCEDFRFPNLIYRFKTIPFKTIAGYFVNIDTLYLKFHREKTPITQHNITEEQNLRTSITQL